MKFHRWRILMLRMIADLVSAIGALALSSPGSISESPSRLQAPPPAARPVLVEGVPAPAGDIDIYGCRRCPLGTPSVGGLSTAATEPAQRAWGRISKGNKNRRFPYVPSMNPASCPSIAIDSHR